VVIWNDVWFLPLGYDFVQVKWGMAVFSMAKLLKTALYSTYAPTIRHHASQPLQNKKEIEWCPSNLCRYFKSAGCIRTFSKSLDRLLKTLENSPAAKKDCKSLQTLSSIITPSTMLKVSVVTIAPFILSNLAHTSPLV